MLLPRGKKEQGHPEVGPGFYPSVIHQLSAQEDPDQWNVDLSPSLTHTVEAMAKVKSIGRGKKYNLMAQVIPIYGFGILLYIFYIIYKLTCKGKTNKSGIHSTVTTANMSNMNITDYELARLQERLLQTEMMMDKIVSEKGHFSSSGRRRKSKSSISKKEEKLLEQLRQITLLMQEGRLDGASPEMEAEEVPYGADWEGYPEETYPEYDVSHDRRGFETIKLEEPPSQPTAEALAESMEQEEEEIAGRKLSILQEEDEEEENIEEDDEEEEEKDIKECEEEEEEQEEEEEEAVKKHLLSLPLPAAESKQERVGLEELQRPNRAKKQITFSDQQHVFRYPREDTLEEEEDIKADEGEEEDDETEAEEEEEEEEEEGEAGEEDDDDDPLMEAESLQFGSEGPSNPEEEAEEDKEDYVFMSALVEGGGHIHTDMPKEVGVSGLRMRNRRET